MPRVKSLAGRKNDPYWRKRNNPQTQLQSPKKSTGSTRVNEPNDPNEPQGTRPTTRSNLVNEPNVNRSFKGADSANKTYVKPPTPKPKSRSTSANDPYAEQSEDAEAPKLKKRRSWRIATGDKPSPAWDGTKRSQQTPPEIIIPSDSDQSVDKDDAKKENRKQKQQVPASSKKQTGGSNDYETLRKRNIKENKDKLESVRVADMARSFKNMAKGNTSKKRKAKEVDPYETDGEYLPNSDSETMLNADEDTPSQKDAPTVETPKKKRGRPKKNPEPTKEPTATSETAPVPPNIKPAALLEELSKKKFVGPRRLYWQTLVHLKVDDVFGAWLSDPWKRFFNISQSVYKELVYEFFSTYRFNKHTQDVTSQSAMYFTLRGKTFNLSISEFAVKMKLYTQDEVSEDAFKFGFTDWPSDENPGDFWKTFGSGDYIKNLSDTHIPSHTHRILHRAISESINQRGSSTNHVTVDDLFYMWCIVEKKPVNLAKCLARFLYKGTGKNETSAVCGGAYVTQLALALEVVSEEELNQMELLGYTGLFDEFYLRRLGILEKDKPWRFVGACNHSGGKGQDGTTSEVTPPSRLTKLESKVDWCTNALQFLINKMGYSFDPPPTVCTEGESKDGAGGPDADDD